MQKQGFFDKLFNLFDWFKSLFFNKELEIAIVGLQNAGKSTFVESILTGEYYEETAPTVGFNYRMIKKDKVTFKVWDMGGQARFRESWEKYCRTASVIIYVVDAADEGNLEIAKLNLATLLAYPTLDGIPLLVLGNKNDLEEALTSEKLSAYLELENFEGRLLACYSISCKNQNNIDVVLKWLSERERLKKRVD